jgi:hypothetical protein
LSVVRCALSAELRRSPTHNGERTTRNCRAHHARPAPLCHPVDSSPPSDATRSAPTDVHSSEEIAMSRLFSWDAMRTVAQDAFAGLILSITIVCVVGGTLAIACRA